jgi:hypothetical protein
MTIDADAQDASPVTLAAARAEFDAAVTYLDTATFRLPPRRSWAALQQALAQWRAGTADAVAYDLPLAAARSSYAHLAGVDPSGVAVGSQVSVFAGLIAANLPDGSEVLTATGDFTSILFPFYAQSGRGIRVREVPLERIAECVTSRTTLVAVSAVQSADGPVADLDALHAAALPPGPGCCWIPPRPSGGCRWTRAASPTPPAADTNGCSPPEAPPTSPSIPTLIDDLTPHHAGWYAGDDPWSSTYGGPLRLASDARRFDVSPAWHAWVCRRPGRAATSPGGHPVPAPARPRPGEPVPRRNRPGASRLRDRVTSHQRRRRGSHGRRADQASARAGRLRLSFHVSTSDQDADLAADVLRRHVTSRHPATL